MGKKILILAGGGIKPLQPFVDAATELGVDLTLASFARLEYKSKGGEIKLTVKGRDLAGFDVVYFRVVGKRFEDVALCVNYCRQKGIKLVDSVYSRNGLIRLPLPKSLEAKLLIEAGVPVPQTYFGRTYKMAEKAVALFGFPFVIKETAGKQGHGVWLAKDKHFLDLLIKEFTPFERKAKSRFIAQKFVPASVRYRVFVIGKRAVAAIARPTRWRKRFAKKGTPEYEGIRHAINPIPKNIETLALKSAKAVGIDVGGVDILVDDKTGKFYVLEVNSAPRWESIKKDTGINIEREIVKYLADIS